MADDRTCLTPASEAWMSGRPASAAVGSLDDIASQAHYGFGQIRGVLEMH